MTDRGIIFSAPMVRGLFEGRKTQTRRMLNPQPPSVEAVRKLSGSGYHWFARKPGDHEWSVSGPVWAVRQITGEKLPKLKVPYAPGDRLWVRESWHAEAWYDRHPAKERPAAIERYRVPHVWYPAGYPSRNGVPGICVLDLDAQWSKGIRRPGMHMPRWASRLTLTVSDVRVERLQDISETAAIAEGLLFRSWEVEEADDMEIVEGWSSDRFHAFKHGVGETAVEGYSILWNSLHTKPGESWQDNPWVVAVSFTVEQRNIDAGTA